MEFCIIGFWILCGLWAGQIYHQRGHSVGWGLLVGFLLGPIGVLIGLTKPDLSK